MTAEVYLYGVVGDEIFAADFISEIRAAKGSPLNVRISSPGGTVQDGIAIYNALKRDGRRIVVHVDSLAGSIASVIAMAGDEIIMHEGSQILVHDPWGGITGTAEEMRRMAAQIDAIRQNILEIYAKRTGKSPGEIAALMSAETMMNAEEAIAQGFATRLGEPLRIAACAPLDKAALARLLMKETKMETDTPTHETAPDAGLVANAIRAERNRAAAIYNAVTNARLAPDFASKLVTDGLTMAEANERIVAEFARVNAPATGPEIRNVIVGTSYDSPIAKNDAVSEAIFCKLSGKAPEGKARELMNLTLAEMSHYQGAPRGWLDKGVRNAAMHTTSDFELALGSAVGRQLQNLMQAAETGASAIAKIGTVRDFRAVQTVRMSSFPSLLPVNEHGEIPHGTLDETGETFKASSFARGLAISFQALVNDDLSAIQLATRDIAYGANELKSSLILDALNTTMSDGKTLFHSDHGNMAATGAAIDVTSLGEGRTAMRLQKALDGTTPLGLQPRILLVPAALETDAEKIIASIQPTQSADANPFANRLLVAAEPRLDAIDDGAWYLFADPGVFECVRFFTLDGYASPVFETQQEWNVLGVSYRCHWHVGAGVVDYRGAFYNEGATAE